MKLHYWNLFAAAVAPHNKSNMDNLVEILKNDKVDWRKIKVAKYTFLRAQVEDLQPQDELAREGAS